jgi:signal transduction histidine kinase/CheY-like chemotaxis protein
MEINPSVQQLPNVAKKIAAKFFIIQLLLLPVLIVIVTAFISQYKRNIAHTITGIVRENLLIGDTRKTIYQLHNLSSEGFSNVAWQSRDFSQKFELNPRTDIFSAARYSTVKTFVYFDAGGTQPAGELVFYYSRGSSITLSLMIWALFFFVFALLGLNERKSFLKEYNTSLKMQVLEANASMAAQVAHDIRSPLVALDSALENTAALPEKQRTIVRHSLNRIRDVANSLLERNRRQQGIAATSHDTGEQLEVRLLSSLIDTVVAEKRMQYASKPGIEMDFTATMESYGIFSALQPVEFGRLLSNLLNNAVEALGDKGKVDVRLTPGDGGVLLSISDNGKGISPEVLAKLGRKGETHGKAGGSGLGLFHARTMAENWGGNLAIASTPGKGTIVTVKLPRAEAPTGFVAALELVPGRSVVVLDDDKGIHALWQKKLESVGLKEYNIEVLYYSEPDGLRAWAKAEPAKAKVALCLFDYELSGHKETGLSLAEELGLCPRTIVISGRSEEKQLIEDCARLKVRSLPKSLLEFVPVKIGVQRQAVLIDDDQIVHMNWETAAEEAGIDLKSYKDPAEFLAALGSFSKATPVYIDSELGVDAKGEDVAATLKEKGFTNLTLVTGYSPERFAHLSWLKVRGKESPWRA